MLTAKERFKVAFLTCLADHGMSQQEIEDTIDRAHAHLTKAANQGLLGMPGAPVAPPAMKLPPMAAAVPGAAPPPPSAVSMTPQMPSTAGTAMPKMAIFGTLATAVKELVKPVASVAGAGLVAAPIAVGAPAGYAANWLTDIDDTDADEVKKRELIDQYQRLSARMQRTRALPHI